MKKKLLYVVFSVIIAILPIINTQANAVSVESQLYQLKRIDQIILVTTDRTNSRNATISYYEKERWTWKWKKVYSSINGVVGKNGVTTNKVEGDGKTPAGIYSLTDSFGTAPKPTNVKLPYTRINKYYYWIDDVTSRDYNKMYYFRGDPKKMWRSYESLTHPLYSYVVEIDYNVNPIVKGKGSAIFLHTKNKSTNYTLGCVAIPKDNLVQIMKRLVPASRPHIIISDQNNLSKTITNFAKTQR